MRALLMLALLLWGGVSAFAAETAQAPVVQFHIMDETDPAEISETTTVFINGRFVARFELNNSHQFEEREINIPVADRYDYALCGRISIRAADGHVEMHVLDDGAQLKNPAGQRLEALAADGFTTFFLGQRTDPGSAPRDLHRTDVCSVPTS